MISMAASLITLTNVLSLFENIGETPDATPRSLLINANIVQSSYEPEVSSLLIFYYQVTA